MELILEKIEKRLIYEKKFLTDKQKYNEYENVLWVFLNKISFNILMNDFLYIIYCCQFLNPKKEKKENHIGLKHNIYTLEVKSYWCTIVLKLA